MAIACPRRRTVMIAAGFALLVGGIVVGALIGCCRRDFRNLGGIGQSLNPKPGGQSPHGPGGVIGYFYYFLREGRELTEMADRDIRRNEAYDALVAATGALQNLRNAKEYYKAILTYGPKWGEEYADAVRRAIQDGKSFIADADKEIQRMAEIKQDMLPRLSSDELFRAYGRRIPLTIPDPEVTVDVLRELETRVRAKDALLRRFRDPNCSIRGKIAYAVGYEVLAAEAKWLTGFAPQSQQPKCQVLRDSILAAAKEIDVFLEGAKLRQDADGQPCKDFIRSERNSMKSRLRFPETLNVKDPDTPSSK